MSCRANNFERIAGDLRSRSLSKSQHRYSEKRKYKTSHLSTDSGSLDFLHNARNIRNASLTNKSRKVSWWTCTSIPSGSSVEFGSDEASTKSRGVLGMI